MTIEEAESLAEHVAGELRSQGCGEVRKLGNGEHVVVLLKYYWLWCPSDWLKFQVKQNTKAVKRSVGRPKRAILEVAHKK